MSQLVSTAEAAEMLGVSARTVTRLARAGELPEAHKSPGKTGARVFDAALVRLYMRSKRPRAQQERRGQDATTTDQEATASCLS